MNVYLYLNLYMQNTHTQKKMYAAIIPQMIIKFKLT